MAAFAIGNQPAKYGDNDTLFCTKTFNQGPLKADLIVTYEIGLYRHDNSNIKN